MSILNKISFLFKEKSNSSIVKESLFTLSHLKEVGVKSNVKTINDVPYEVMPKNGRLIKGDRIGRTHEYGCFYSLYNEQGNKLERRQSHEDYDNVSDDKYFGLKYLYDSNNRLTEKHFYDYNDQIHDFYTHSKSIYIYNSIGQIITKRVYNYENKLIYDVHCNYDNKGNKIETRTIPNKNARYSKDQVKFYYDQFNNLIKKEDYQDYESIKETTQYHYDSNNELKYKIIFDRNNEKIKEITYLRDQYGNVTEEKSNSKIILLNEYKYDKFGNWISKETCQVSHIIKESSYLDFEEEQWLIDSGSHIMGDRVLIEREIIYY